MAPLCFVLGRQVMFSVCRGVIPMLWNLTLIIFWIVLYEYCLSNSRKFELSVSWLSRIDPYQRLSVWSISEDVDDHIQRMQ